MIKKTIDLTMKFLIIFTIALGLLWIFRPDLVKDFIEYIRNIILWLWDFNYFIVFITSIIESFPVLWVVVPGQNIILIVWWFFWEQSYNNLFYVILLACIWAICWNYIWYLLWKYYWKEFFKHYGLWFGIWETEVNYLEKWVKRWWAWWIIFWKFHGLTRAFIPFIAWSMWMKNRNFIIYNIIGSIIWSTTIIILWVMFSRTYELILDYLFYIIIWIMFLWGFYIWKFKKKEFMKYMEEKNKEINEKIK